MTLGGEGFVQLAGLEDSYDQIQKMAIGGMAEVYRARQIGLDRPVAIKRVRPELRGNADIKERFRREAKSSANLLHQNLAHVYDFKLIGDEAYIVMEYIDGFDLAEIIARCGPLPVDVATMIAVKMLLGLGYVHSHAMVHRDVKPDNVRLNTRGDVKIMDFGIAYDPGDMNLTMPGTLIGSPHYLSPEQIKGDKLDQRVDIFAFGISFYEMLTGKKPFFETQDATVYNRIARGDYAQPETLRPELPHFLSKIIENCLQVNPAKRPKSADAIETALTQFLQTNYTLHFEPRIRQYLLQSGLLQGNPQLIEVGERTGEVVVRGKPSKGFDLSRRQWAAASAVAAVLAVVTAWFLREPRNPPAPASTDEAASHGGNVSGDGTAGKESGAKSDAKADAPQVKSSEAKSAQAKRAKHRR